MDVAALASVIAAAAPLVFAVVGETLSERVGVVNLSLDGSILLAALAAFATGVVTGNVALAFLVAAVVGAAVAAIVAVCSIRLGLDQIAVGFVLTLLAAELSAYLGSGFVGRRGVAVPHTPIPGLAEIPVLGPLLFDHGPTVYASLLLVPLAWWLLFRTRPGLELRAAGERPEAAWARGIDPNRLRYVWTILGGAFVGLAGAAFSLDVKLGWSEGHTRNFGWIALAIVIFGGWHPVRAALGCWFFGLLQVAATQAQPSVPALAQVLPILPFPLMILTLVVVNRDALRRLADRRPGLRGLLAADAPAALGTVFRQP